MGTTLETLVKNPFFSYLTIALLKLSLLVGISVLLYNPNREKLSEDQLRRNAPRDAIGPVWDVKENQSRAKLQRERERKKSKNTSFPFVVSVFQRHSHPVIYCLNWDASASEESQGKMWSLTGCKKKRHTSWTVQGKPGHVVTTSIGVHWTSLNVRPQDFSQNPQWASDG